MTLSAAAGIAQATEEIIGANHPTKEDTHSRAHLVDHDQFGAHVRFGKAMTNDNGATVPANRLVKLDTPANSFTQTVGGDEGLAGKYGVTAASSENSDQEEVVTIGYIVVDSTGALAVGNEVTPSATAGKVKAAADGDFAIGIVLVTAGLTNQAGVFLYGWRPRLTRQASTQGFRGLHLRTSPNANLAPHTVELIHADEIVTDDGERVLNVNNLTASQDAANGAGGRDTGTEQASTWYEVHYIRKRSDGTEAILFHRAPNYASAAAFTTAPDAERALRLATGTATDKLAQGLKFSASAELHFVLVKLKRTGAVSGRIWFSLQADSAGSPDGTPIASTDKIDASKIATSEQQILLIFRSPGTPAATPTQYHLVLEGDYTRSDAVYIAWRGVAAGGYGDGSAKEYNGAAWGAASGVGDFNFDAYVEQNNAAVTMPSGYDQKCLLGYFYNNGSSNLNRLVYKDRRAQPYEGQSSGDVATAAMTLIDFSSALPPVPVLVAVHLGQDTLSAPMLAGAVPEGYSTSVADGVRGFAASASAGNPQNIIGNLVTEYQRIYVSNGGSGNARAFIGEWQW